MGTVLVVLLLGLGLGALGLLASDLYAVGAELLFIATVGFLVRAGDLWHRLRR